MAKKSIETLKQWFETGDYPTQEQFWDWLDSFVHKDAQLTIENIEELEDILQSKADASQLAGLTNRIVVSPGESSKVIPAGTFIDGFWVMADEDIVYSIGTTEGGNDIIDGEPTSDLESVYKKDVPCKTQRTLYFSGVTINTIIIILKR